MRKLNTQEVLPGMSGEYKVRKTRLEVADTVAAASLKKAQNKKHIPPTQQLELLNIEKGDIGDRFILRVVSKKNGDWYYVHDTYRREDVINTAKIEGDPSLSQEESVMRGAKEALRQRIGSKI